MIMKRLCEAIMEKTSASEHMIKYPAVMATQTSETGSLRVDVTSAVTNRPIENASVEIAYSDTPGTLYENLITGTDGRTDAISLPSPPLEYSMAPSSERPYGLYTLTIRANGFEPVIIRDTEILPAVLALQNIVLIPSSPQLEDTAETFLIPPHTLYGEYPPPIIEDEIKPIGEFGEIVLPEVVIPEFIVVHDGAPNSNAPNYYVRYRDYIKNVASSEIYATWPEATIYANILAIQSFTLNRVYTEWYRNQGYNFTITSSTAYDHKWINERNIFDNISSAVDDIFNNYLSRPNIKQPILTQYCDGDRVTCPGIMSQWGSKYLGDEGYNAIEILRNYYGSSIYINSAEEVQGVPVSWPGYEITEGVTGEDVITIQEQLNEIASVYTIIPRIAVDGIYGPRTAEAVSAFQEQFGLPVTGTVGFSTWYKLSFIYVAITDIAEYTP